MTASGIGGFRLLFLAVGLALAAPAEAVPDFPLLNGRVVDQANVLPDAVERDLSAKLETLEATTSRQLVVVTVASLQGYEIEDYGYQLGRAWGIGEARKDTGVLLVAAPNEQRARIEVGYGLEPILTDAVSNAILQESILPRFHDGDIADGIVDGAEALIGQLSLPTDQARLIAAAASGEAKTDLFSLVIIGFVLFWLVAGLAGTMTGRGADIWLWPLLFLMRSGRGSRDVFRGRGGSFGGGGASGRW